MDKWADFVITAVRYNEDSSHIIKVKRNQDEGNDLGADEIITRSKVVEDIEKGITYVTSFKNQSGEWTKGKRIHIIKIDGKKYLRTDKTTDNLDNLPEF